MPFHNRRWDGDFLTLQALLRQGAVGRPVVLRSRFDRFRPTPREGTWKETAGVQNGLLMDLGPHVVDQALLLFGRPRTVAASVRTDRGGSVITDAFDAVLEFEYDGQPVRVELGATMLAAVAEPRFRLRGTRGEFVKFGVDPQEPKIVAGAVVPAVGSGEDWLTEAEGEWGVLTTAADSAKPAELERRTVATERGDYRTFYEAVGAAIRRGAEPPTRPRDAVRVARLLDLAVESARTGRTLTIDERDW